MSGIEPEPELELELEQPHVAQKPVLRGEVGELRLAPPVIL